MENKSADPLSTVADNHNSDDEINTDDVNGKSPDKLQWDAETQDLFITVDNPEKHILSMETYISYNVSTKTTRSSFDNSEYVVQRRYQDFIWLRGKLETSHPTHLIPPLPSKFVVKGMLDRFSLEFTETRCRALHTFLVRLSQHPVLSFNESLKVFLTAKAHEFTAYRKQGEGIMSKVSGSVKSMATSARPKERDPEFTDMLDYISDFNEKMGVLDRIGERLLTEKKALSSELKEFAPTFSMWATSEDEIISPIMTSMSGCIDACAKAAEENAKTHEIKFIPPLKEYILYSEAIKQVLKRRDNYQAIADRSTEDYNKRKNEKENLPQTDQSYSIGALMGKSASDVKQQKEAKLIQLVDDLAKKRDQASDDLEQANANLRADKDRWAQHKIQDVATLFSEMADAQINFHNECLSAWESILPSMQEQDNDQES